MNFASVGLNFVITRHEDLDLLKILLAINRESSQYIFSVSLCHAIFSAKGCILERNYLS